METLQSAGTSGYLILRIYSLQLLHYGGKSLYEIYETLPDTGEDFKTLKDKFGKYFEPKKNKEYEIYKFRQARQNADETVDEYHTHLRQLLRNCEFHNVNGEIKSQMIQCCASSKLRRKGLKTADISLEQLLDDARALEKSEVQASGTEVNIVNSVSNQRRSKDHRNTSNPRFMSIQGNQKSCYNCGGQWPHSRACPAIDRSCHNCGKLGHFSKCCCSQKPNKQKVLKIDEEDYQRDAIKSKDSESLDDEYTFTVLTQAVNRDRPDICQSQWKGIQISSGHRGPL